MSHLSFVSYQLTLLDLWCQLVCSMENRSRIGSYQVNNDRGNQPKCCRPWLQRMAAGHD
ncbi:hypothetical protein KC19_7G113000 [Ceratodon purpureus]|uniref:Uncharacterized protein n=1 Tax=Ceratodon purpureus TaxID=3225 RepID=A0A8T0HDI8_CERPU|nr:hypothetical protein KC19_7G113000 [Ceratodon purpureus]